MRTIAAEELKDILAKHKKWLNDEEGGERADLRGADLSYVNLYGADLREADLADANLSGADLKSADLKSADLRFADLQCADLRFANLQGTKLSHANLKYIKRRWFVYTGAIGSRNAETLYFADGDNVRCGCWNDYKGGTLAEFKARIDEAYPADSENEEYQRYRIEYLSAIKMFESMREAYLKSAEKEKDNEKNI